MLAKAVKPCLNRVALRPALFGRERESFLQWIPRLTLPAAPDVELPDPVQGTPSGSPRPRPSIGRRPRGRPPPRAGSREPARRALDCTAPRPERVPRRASGARTTPRCRRACEGAGTASKNASWKCGSIETVSRSASSASSALSSPASAFPSRKRASGPPPPRSTRG